MRRFGQNPRAGIRYRHRPGAYAVLPQEGRLLLTHEGGLADEIQLPGGGIDPGESPLRALHREVMEETGWHIAAPRLIGTFRRFAFAPDYDDWFEKVCHIYLARPTLCLGPPKEPHHTALWVDADLAADMLGNPVDRFVVASLRI